ncbi:UNVERIFIED_CONTAM: hypothetical protein K2H54_024624 [Gekko kuhli]
MALAREEIDNAFVFLCSEEIEDKLIPKTEYVMSAHANDTPEQGHQMSPPTLGYFSVGPLLQAPTVDDLGMASSLAQAPALSGLENALAQSHLSRSLEQSSTVQTQTLRNLEKVGCQIHSVSLLHTELLISCSWMNLCQGFHKYLLEHLNDLKKENFSLKLRIYFLEERMQQKYEATRDDVYRRFKAAMEKRVA